MLIPQSLAYAMLAGLPPQVGLYASILPLVAYALLGSSMTLAVGPVAVVSLMTASALQPLATAGSAEYAALAVQLALISGVMLLAFGALRLGFLAYLLSHPVISGFITGSALLIAIGQLPYILGVSVPGVGALDKLAGLANAWPQAKLPTLLDRRRDAGVPVAGAAFDGADAGALGPVRFRGRIADQARAHAGRRGVDGRRGHLAARQQRRYRRRRARCRRVCLSSLWCCPMLDTLGLLWLPALLIALVGFVESVSVAQSLALKRQQRIVPNRELLGLGAANLASALSGGYPVTGGFARSVVNFAAGAHTPLAGVVSALLMGLVIAALTGLFFYLPHAVLAATIIVAVIGLVDLDSLRRAWRYDRADAMSLLGTALGVVLLGVEAGILTGVTLSLGALVWRSSRPHMAVVGRVPGTEHFRNVLRHQVETVPGLLALRVDESLFFANATVVEDRIGDQLRADPQLRQVLLICSAVNQIDATALEVLTELERSLAARGMVFMLAEVKGPVMDRLRATDLGRRLDGHIFLSVHEAFVSAQRAADLGEQAPRAMSPDF